MDSFLIQLNMLVIFIQNYLFLWHLIGCFILITVILAVINHTNIFWAWRSLHPSFYALYPSPSCCLPAVLYFRPTYLEVIQYLKDIHCSARYAIDHALDDLPQRTNLDTYLIEPNLVHHIGLFSRLHRTYGDLYALD
jgi:hypothetical protein